MITPAGYTPAAAVPAAPATVPVAAAPQETFTPTGHDAPAVPSEAAVRALFGSRVSGEHQLWQVKLFGENVKAAPAVGPDGTLFAVTDEGLSAISPEGKVLWETPHKGLQGYATPLVSPDGKTIYVSGEYKTPGLSAYDEHGKLQWQKELGTAQVPPVFGPEGSLYFGDYAGGVYRLDPKQDPTWTRDIGRHVNGEMGVLSDGTLVLIGDPGSLHTFRADGTPAFEGFNGELGERLRTCVGVCITPEDEIVAVNSSDQLLCMDASGQMKWRFAARFEKPYDELTRAQQDECWWGNTSLGTTPVMSADRQTIYVGGNEGKLFAIDRNGNKRWSLQVGDDMSHHGVQLGADGTIYTACERSGRIHAVSPEGKTLWTYEPDADKKSQYAYIATHDREVYLVTHEGNLYALSADAVQQRLAEARSSAPQGPPPTIKVDDGFVVINGVRVPVRKA